MAPQTKMPENSHNESHSFKIVIVKTEA